MNVYVSGKQVRLMPRKVIGKGGEADVYRHGSDQVLKIWKAADHPDFRADPREQDAAQARLAMYQEKMLDYPPQFPGRVVAPLDLAMDRSGKRILGFTMPRIDNAEVLLRYGEPRFRQTGPSNETVRRVLLDLHKTIQQVHDCGVVIGDFNDLNVLIRDEHAFLIDADSFQFGQYPCSVYTARFVDPLLCDRRQSLPMLKQPHNQESDWYAFTIMAMQCWLMVGPYGGIYRPTQSSARVPHDARPLHRITVFDSQVRYPKPARRPEILPDEWLEFFRQMFERDWRGEFPIRLLKEIRWTKCGQCGDEHARPHCPHCVSKVQVPVAAAVHVAGNVEVTTVADLPGILLAAAAHEGRCLWLAKSPTGLVRENGSSVSEPPRSVNSSYHLQNDRTWVVSRGQASCTRAGVELAEFCSLDEGVVEPTFAVNRARSFWTHNDSLYGSGALGPEFIGQVLSPRTRIWVGEKLGFGLCLAGELQLGYLFDTSRPGICDQLSLPRLGGQLIDIDCYLSDERVWIFSLVQYAGQQIYRCHLLDRRGQLIASGEDVDREHWLTAMHGNVACGEMLLVATDEGIVRVDAQGHSLSVSRMFSATESLVDANTTLLPGPGGLFAATTNRIDLIQVS